MPICAPVCSPLGDAVVMVTGEVFDAPVIGIAVAPGSLATASRIVCKIAVPWAGVSASEV